MVDEDQKLVQRQIDGGMASLRGDTVSAGRSR